MKQAQLDFLDVTQDATLLCGEIEAVLKVLRDFSEQNENTNENFIGLTVLTEFLLEKSNKLFNQINEIELFVGKLDFD